MKYIKITLSTLLLLVSGVCNGQNIIKKIILEDLLLLNNLADSCIFQHSQEFYFIDGDDTQHFVKTIDSVGFLTNMIHINKIDTVGSYLYINASIGIITYHQFLFLLRNKSFDYIVKMESGRLYKINGFLMSEILLCRFEGHYDDILLCKYLNIKYRDLKKRNIRAIRKSVKIAVMDNNNSNYLRRASNSYIIPKLCKQQLR